MSASGDIAIRDARDEDAGAVASIYAPYVIESTGNYEDVPPDAAGMTERLRAVRGAGLPWLVVESDAEIVGFCFAQRFRSRHGYRHTVESTVYVQRSQHGRGLGRRLLEALIARCETLGFRQMIAVIGDARNEASVALHRACGFREVALFSGIGWKHGQWLDNLQMQRALGEGHTTPPTRP